MDFILLSEINKKDNHYAKQFFARHGFCRDEFTYDPDYRVRAEIARLGHNLNILMHDKDWRVRKEVAKQGYGLLTLQNDANKEVSDTAKRLLKRGSC